MSETEGCGSGVWGRKTAPNRVLPGSIQSGAVLNIYRYTRAGARKVQPTAVERLRLVAVGFVCRYGDRFGQM